MQLLSALGNMMMRFACNAHVRLYQLAGCDLYLLILRQTG
jgi:hypothetical protein